MKANRLLMTVSGTISAVLFCWGQALGAPPPQEPSFYRHVIPVLSKLGCNAGACHGMVQGRGGFRLSLYGYQPEADHHEMVKGASGRRINPIYPDTSLILLKAAGQVPHEGGMRTAVGSFEYQILRNWIASGGRIDSPEKSRVQKVVVSPSNHTVKPAERFSLKVEVVYADGSQEDVTNFCTFEARNREVAEVYPQGLVEAQEVGATGIIVRYAGQISLVSVVVCPQQSAGDFPRVQEHNFIDRHILARLRLLGITPAELCDDATFLRRVTLDVIGALPTPDEVRAFLADKNPDKRARKIEELLAHPDYAAMWANKFMDYFRLSAFTAGGIFPPNPHEEFRAYEWLRARLQENLPYDELAARILLATTREGRSLEQWAESALAIAQEQADGKRPTTYAARKTLDLFWQRRMTTDVDHAIRVAHAFLGLRLQCAQCHRHPFDVWTQEDLLSFANFFMRIPHMNNLAQPRAKASGEVLALQKKLIAGLPAKNAEIFRRHFGDYEIWVLTQSDLDGPGMKNGRSFFNSGLRPTGFAIVTSPLGTQTSTQLRLLGEKEPTPIPPDGVDRRELVVDWLRRPDNPFFAKAIVNRVWVHYLGRSIVDPPDDLSPLNPASHPELLQELCDGFIKNKYDLKWLHRTILNSRTYQQSSQNNPSNRHDRRNFASFYLRRLPAEVLLDCWLQAAGVKPGTLTDRSEPGMPAQLRMVQGGALFYRRNSDTNFVLDAFGRPKRDAEVQCDCEREDYANVLQALILANHPWARKAIEHPNNRLTELLQKPLSEEQRITELFLATLSRPPTTQELATSLEFLKSGGNPRKSYEGLLWSLLNSNEFLFNH